MATLHGSESEMFGERENRKKIVKKTHRRSPNEEIFICAIREKTKKIFVDYALVASSVITSLINCDFCRLERRLLGHFLKHPK